MHPYGTFCRPNLVEQLELVGLDAIYERAEGDILWRRVGEELIPVLDMVGGFGANLFGHWHPELTAYARQLLDQRVPVFAQGSIRGGAAELGRRLAERLGSFVIIFTNSGTETIEAALKHAHLERQRSLFWAIRGGFHGKSSGAIQLTWNYHQPFVGIGPNVRFLDPDNPDDWEAARRSAGEVAAAFVEPIQGEAGVRPLPRNFVEWLGATCREFDIPLVADEIQTGIGRTGSFLASHTIGLDPDYICLGKALGGGVAKIGALLVRSRRYVPRFSMIHTSTYAEDDWSSLLSLKALDILERDSLLDRCAQSGACLVKALEALRQKFPEQIQEVRGTGLLIGLELRKQVDGSSESLRAWSDQGRLGYVAASYLLNVHRIRVLPTLSDPLTLRLEPSAYITQSDIERVTDGVERYCEAVQAEDVVHLLQHRLGRSIGVTKYRGAPRSRHIDTTPRRVAFIGHFLDGVDAVAYEPSLVGLEPEEIDTFLDLGLKLLDPAVVHCENVRSATGAEVHLKFIGLPITARQIARTMRDGNWAWVMQKVALAAEVAKREGCQILGLGGYTSILSADCRRLRVDGVGLTSGNALTVGMSVRALREAAAIRGIDLANERLAVVGAAGNIGRAVATILAPDVQEVVLIVRDPMSARATRLLKEIRMAAPRTIVSVSGDMAAVYGCSMIVTATNAGEAMLRPEHVQDGPAVLCDIAVPGDVAPSVSVCRPGATVLQGGLVRLPRDPEFSIPAVPLPPGHVYACLAETLLMGLADRTSHGSYGAIEPSQVHDILELADLHEFTSGAVAMMGSKGGAH